ncbi:protein FAM240B [Gouania willdenowi]|uniref:protein FAM240B n=1 Tax=Gouania willdenowi TaxID=441366 RepID=UPI001056B408|nr:protein FAM240A [Gouania willdenowi]
MNVAKIHDRLYIKTFWEKRIESQSEQKVNEDQRRSRSALSRLRSEWLVRLENRNSHMKNFNETFYRKSES